MLARLTSRSGCPASEVTRDLLAKGELGVHRREICREVTRAGEISTASQTVYGSDQQRSDTRPHQTRPTGRLTHPLAGLTVVSCGQLA